VERSALVYSLTAEGDGCYPMNYDVLANALLDELRSAYGATGLEEVISGVAARMAQPQSSLLKGASAEDRVEATCTQLREQDVVANWERDGDVFLLHRRTCPYPEEALRNSAACVIDVAYIRELTGMDARLVEWRVRGDRPYTYRLQPLAAAV